MQMKTAFRNIDYILTLYIYIDFALFTFFSNVITIPSILGTRMTKSNKYSSHRARNEKYGRLGLNGCS